MRTHRTLDLRSQLHQGRRGGAGSTGVTADEAAVLRYLLVKPFEKFWEKANSISILVSRYIKCLIRIQPQKVVAFLNRKAKKYRRKKTRRKRSWIRNEKPTGEVVESPEGSEEGNEVEASSAPEEPETVTPKAQKAQKVAELVKKLNDEMVGVKQHLDVILQFIQSKE